MDKAAACMGGWGAGQATAMGGGKVAGGGDKGGRLVDQYEGGQSNRGRAGQHTFKISP